MRHRYTPLFAFLIATLLAACGQHQAPAVTGELVTITLRTDAITKPTTNLAPNLAPQGVPTDSNGDSAVKYLEISVFDAQGQAVHFDNENRYDPTGGKTILSLEAGVSSVTLKLPTSSSGYTFKVKGFENQGGVWLAYGETHSPISHQTTTIKLGVHTLLGTASLEPSAPLHYIVPGQRLDLYLKVSTQGGTYRVPLKDFSASYSLASTMGELVSGSELGARITVTSAASSDDFTVSATVTGWQEVDGNAEKDRSISTSFTKPFLQTTGATFDLEASSVSFNPPANSQPGESITLAGSADDNVGIDRLRVYEGPVLLGSSAADEYAQAGVAQVVFTGTNWSMSTSFADEGSYGLKAVAIDTSGNQSEALASLAVATPNYTVVTNSNDSGEGSLRWAIANAPAGSTITFDSNNLRMLASSSPQTITLTSDLVIGKNLTIQGPGESLLAISGNNSVRVFAINPGSTVTLSDLTVERGRASGNFGAGVLNYGSLTLSHVTVKNSSAGFGGGIMNWQGATITLSDVTVSGNTATNSGGGIYNYYGTLTLTNTAITGNTATSSGGGIFNDNGTFNGDLSGVTGNTPDNIHPQ